MFALFAQASIFLNNFEDDIISFAFVNIMLPKITYFSLQPLS